MRRFQALLIVAGLAAAPTSAVAGPSSHQPRPSPSVVEQPEASPGQGHLGVLVMGITPELRKHLGATEDRGVLVSRVEPLSPARAAGISVGDVIVAVRGHKISGGQDVALALAGLGKGEEVAIELVRSGKPLTVRAQLAARPGLSWLPDWAKLFEPPSPPPPPQTSWLHKLQAWLQPPQARAPQS